MAPRDLLADMHSINALGLEPAVPKGGDKAKLKQIPSQKVSQASSLKADFRSSLEDITKAMDKKQKKAEEDAVGSSTSPVMSSTAATLQPLSAILDAFLIATKGASSSSATVAWSDATGPSYKQILGEPNPNLKLAHPGMGSAEAPTLPIAPAGSTSTSVPAAAVGGAYRPPHARGGQNNGQARGGPAHDEQSETPRNKDRADRNRRSQRESQGAGNGHNQWQAQQHTQQFQQPQPQPGGMGGMMMVPMNMMQPGGMGMMQVPQGFDASQMPMVYNPQMMQMGYPGHQAGGKNGGDNRKGGGGGSGGGAGQSNDQQAQMMQMGAPGSFVMPTGMQMMPGMMQQGGHALMVPMMMQAPQQGVPQGAMMMGMIAQPGQQ